MCLEASQDAKLSAPCHHGILTGFTQRWLYLSAADNSVVSDLGITGPDDFSDLFGVSDRRYSYMRRNRLQV